MNILPLGVSERTLELGVPLTVGARQVDLLIQFIFEGLALATLRGAAGVPSVLSRETT
jgi:putative ABC transport system permease protein